MLAVSIWIALVRRKGGTTNDSPQPCNGRCRARRSAGKPAVIQPSTGIPFAATTISRGEITGFAASEMDAAMTRNAILTVAFIAGQALASPVSTQSAAKDDWTHGTVLSGSHRVSLRTA
jgi:hypothetical protein